MVTLPRASVIASANGKAGGIKVVRTHVRYQWRHADLKQNYMLSESRPRTRLITRSYDGAAAD